LVTEDWRFRMVTPPKGDYASVPINPAGRRVADAWDPAKDVAAGDDDPETHYNLGVAFREMGLLDEAIAELQKVCSAIERGKPCRINWAKLAYSAAAYPSK